MRKLFLILFLALPFVGSAENKTWSFYGNVGLGSATLTTLEGLALTPEGQQFFAVRGLSPEFKTTGNVGIAPNFTLGASRYFDNIRVSAQIGTQSITQSNYKALSFYTDALAGYNFLSGNHELFAEAGVGLYNVYNDYVFHWEGRENGKVIETYEESLGEHDVHSLSFPVKLSYNYNVYKNHWAGAYVMARFNTAPNNFCPTVVASVGAEYRYTLGSSKVKMPAKHKGPVYVYVDRTVTVVDTVYTEKVIDREVVKSIDSDVYVVNFDTDSYRLSFFEKRKLDEAINKMGHAKQVIVTGYTDSTASELYNLDLSFNRAKAVFTYLKDNGISPMMISYAGASETQPIDSNNTSDGRANNRRVEITIIY